MKRFTFNTNRPEHMDASEQANYQEEKDQVLAEQLRDFQAGRPGIFGSLLNALRGQSSDEELAQRLENGGASQDEVKSWFGGKR